MSRLRDDRRRGTPFVYLSAAGKFQGEFLEGSRSGWADSQARFTVNLLGGPALTLAEWANFRQKRTLGVGLTVSMPTGQYDSNHLINFGGRTYDDGNKNLDLQTNSRVGLTFSIPLSDRHSIRVAAHTGAYTRFGADFDVGTFTYQYRWGQP